MGSINKFEEDRFVSQAPSCRSRTQIFHGRSSAGPSGQTDNFPTENISLAADPTDSLVSERWIVGWGDGGIEKHIQPWRHRYPGGWEGGRWGRWGGGGSVWKTGPEKQVPSAGTTSWGAAGPFHCRAGEPIKTKLTSKLDFPLHWLPCHCMALMFDCQKLHQYFTTSATLLPADLLWTQFPSENPKGKDLYPLQRNVFFWKIFSPKVVKLMHVGSLCLEMCAAENWNDLNMLNLYSARDVRPSLSLGGQSPDWGEKGGKHMHALMLAR